MGLDEFRARGDTQFLVEPRSGFLEHLQRCGLLPGRAQRDHQPGQCPLVERFALGQGPQLLQHPAVPARRGGRLRVFQYHRRALAGQRRHRRMSPQQPHIRRRLTAPQPRRPRVKLTRPRRVPARRPLPGPRRQPRELQDVQLLRPQPEQVALAQRHQELMPLPGFPRPATGPERVPEPAHVRLDHADRARRGCFSPDRVDDARPVHRVARAHREQGQHGPLPLGTQVEREPAPPRHQRPEHGQPDVLRRLAAAARSLVAGRRSGQPGQVMAVQPERLGQALGRPAPRPAGPALLKIADGADADPGTLGQRPLRQACRPAPLLNQDPQLGRRLTVVPLLHLSPNLLPRSATQGLPPRSASETPAMPLALGFRQL